MSRKIFERDVMGCYSQMIHVFYIYCTYIYHKNHLYVGKYTIDGSYGIWWEFAMKSEEVLFFCFGGRVASLETRCIACMRCWSRVECWCLVEFVERVKVCTACLWLSRECCVSRVYSSPTSSPKMMCSISGVGARERFFSFWEGAEDEEAVDVLFTDGSMVEDRGSLCCNGRWIDSVSGVWTWSECFFSRWVFESIICFWCVTALIRTHVYRANSHNSSETFFRLDMQTWLVFWDARLQDGHPKEFWSSRWWQETGELQDKSQQNEEMGLVLWQGGDEPRNWGPTIWS